MEILELKEVEEQCNCLGFMTNQEKLEERKLCFKAMSSHDSKALLRKKMKPDGLEEGTGVKPLFSCDI